MNDKKEAEQAERLKRILALMDHKNAQYMQEIETRKAQLTLRDLEKIKKWWKFIKILNFAIVAFRRVEFIRLEKKLNGPIYSALLKLQAWFRDMIAFRRQKLDDLNEAQLQKLNRRRSTKISWKAGLENLKPLLEQTHQRELIAERTHSCTVLLTFIRAVTKCFRGYVHKFIL
jgi:hypothetical protein